MSLPMQLTDWLLVEVALLLIGLTLEIILIEGNANVVILKKLPAADDYLLRSRIPYPPLTQCIPVYNIHIHTEKRGGGELNQR
jgi:hypothetical protein